MGDFRWKRIEDDGQQALFSNDEAFDRRREVGEFGGLEFFHVRARKIINEVPGASRAPFRHTINAYRGCSHACTYCFARPTHSYLNFDIAGDFDKKIVVKINAVERLRAELSSKSWQGEGIAMGTNTDPYQRAEGKYQLTRGLIAELVKARNPFSILTKSTLISRDTDLLRDAVDACGVSVSFSIPTLDVDVWRATEPQAPHPKQRVAAIKRLTAAGIKCDVLMAPVLPGISDGRQQLKDVVNACVDAGAGNIAASALHLKPALRAHWMAWLRDWKPELVDDYEALYETSSYLAGEHRAEVNSAVKQLVASRRQKVANSECTTAHSETFGRNKRE